MPINGKVIRKFSNEHHRFVIEQFFQTDNLSEIARRFQSEFGVSITPQRVRQIKQSKYVKEIVTAIRAKYDTGINLEPLSSVRSRVKALQRITDIAMEKYHEEEKLSWLQLAANTVMRINEILMPDKKEVNILNITQSDGYSAMNLQEIREKKLNLLKELERVKLNKEVVCLPEQKNKEDSWPPNSKENEKGKKQKQE